MTSHFFACIINGLFGGLFAKKLKTCKYFAICAKYRKMEKGAQHIWCEMRVSELGQEWGQKMS